MEWNVLFELELKCSLLLLTSFLLLLLIRRLSAAQRHLVLMLAVWGGLLIPVAHFLLPHWETALLTPFTSKGINAISIQQMKIPEESAPPFSPNGSIDPADTDSLTEPACSTSTVSPQLAVAPELPARISPSQIAGWIGLGGMACITLSLLIANLSAQSIVRHAVPIKEDWKNTWKQIKHRVPLARNIALLESDSRLAPMALGLFRSTVVLPEEAHTWSEQKRSAVLMHELAHIKRKDCLTHLLCGAVLALHWFNPLFWIAIRRLRLEREHACDDYVLTNGAEAADYADQLLELARIQSGVPLLSTAITMARRNALEGRLLAILDSGRRRSALGLGAISFALLLTAGVALPLASATGQKEDALLQNPIITVTTLSEAVNEPIADVAEEVNSTALTNLLLAANEITTEAREIPEEQFIPAAAPSEFVEAPETNCVEIVECTPNASLFLDEWIELDADDSAALHLWVEENGQALLQGGDVRKRMQWTLNYDELVLTTGDGMRTADISPDDLLIYRKGGKEMMRFRRSSSSIEVAQTEPIEFIPDAAEQIQVELVSAPVIAPIDPYLQQLEARLRIAGKVIDINERDAVFTGIAVDAARFGMIDMTLTTLGRIVFPQTRDKAASQCADQFILLDMTAEAERVANAIVFYNTKKEVLLRIAKGRSAVSDRTDRRRPSRMQRSEYSRQLEARLNMAVKVISITDRDEILTGIAVDAARYQFIDLVLQALDKITFPKTRDEAAAQSAKQFVQMGMAIEAERIAEKITFYNTKKEVMEMIARGPIVQEAPQSHSRSDSAENNQIRLHIPENIPDQAIKQVDQALNQIDQAMKSMGPF